MKRRQKRKLIALAILLILLALLVVWFVNFQATKNLTLDLRAPAQDAIEAPSYLYSFAGEGANHLQQPIGVLATDSVVYVTDGRLGQVSVFRENGQFVRAFGKGKLVTPLYLAKNPKDGNIYVADRRTRSIQVFKPSGPFVRVFDPKLPKDQLPKFDTKGDQWVPVALDFAPDGSMYVIELLNGHRVLQFGPDGTFVRAIGTSGAAGKAEDLTGKFQFPNSIKVHRGELYVADSNNRRVQVFDLKGEFKRVIKATGLPRGIAFLPRPSNATSETTDKFVVVDTLSHDGTIFSVDGKQILQFGERGVLDAQFNYPNDTSVGSKSVIFVTDTGNTRVQAWGWPQAVSPVPRVLPRNPWWCLLPLLLLLIPLLRRKKRFYATADFIEAAIANGDLATLVHRRREWLVSEADYALFKGRTEDGIDLGEMLTATEHSDTDARSLAERLEIELERAAILSSAKRTKALCTEDADLRRIAKVLELDVYNATEFAAKFGMRDSGPSPDVNE